MFIINTNVDYTGGYIFSILGFGLIYLFIFVCVLVKLEMRGQNVSRFLEV